MSKTHNYRKVVKPLIERKRRARINPSLDLDRFHAGFTTCATEVSRSLASSGVDISIGSRLMGHLGHKLNTIESSRVAPLTVRVPEQRLPKHIRVVSPVSDCGYSSGRESTPSPNFPVLPSASSKVENL